jgi:hypothetical protein
MLTSERKRTFEIKFKSAMAKAAFSKKRDILNSTVDVKLMKKLVKCYI